MAIDLRQEPVADIIFDPNATLQFAMRWGALSWVTATLYERGDVIWDPADGFYYRCKSRHTSQAARADDSAKWSKAGDQWLSRRPADAQLISSVATNVAEESGVEGSPTLIVTPSVELGAVRALLDVTGGTAGLCYLVGVRITTDDTPGRVDERTLRFQVSER